ncbi:MAG: cytochrome b/b6 domain-containing protein [Fimbriimonadaceae bacterium]|nr:cytochrome b/b6 domain-containing protein [Fimbriimonadaceae bacterium]
MKRRYSRFVLLLFACAPFVVAALFAQPQTTPTQAEPERSEEVQACMGCHDPAAESGTAVHLAALDISPHKELDCTSCHAEFTAEAPHSDQMLASKPACANCHVDQTDQFAASVHARPDKQPGDHPTCVSCHATTDPHSVTPAASLTRKDLVKVCSDCHRDENLMARYGPNTDAVHSYELSFHGKAFLKFGNNKTAICTDCHGYHDVKSPSDPEASTNVNNIAETCGQPDCHPGATMNFGMSGASHMHLKIKETPILGGIELFFKVLTFAVVGFLLLGVAMDIRRSMFGKTPPPAGRLIGSLIAFGFLALVIAIICAILGLRGGFESTLVALGLIAIAVILNRFRPKPPKPEHTGPMYERFSLSLRIQHILLAVSFTLLVITGMPIRYPENSIMGSIYMALGGMPVMRLVHRIAAVVMIAAWIYHTIELIFKWYKAGFSMKSWTMWPSFKDFKDFFAVIKYHLGLAPAEPAYDRFAFREKFDYFAVYWGMPIMVLSGLILWYPVYAAEMLPALGIPIAYIAHADEAVLAFLTIVTWHFYNTHFNPNHFPMNPVFITGKLTEEEMEREHPLELERIKAAQVREPEATPEPSEPPSTTDDPSE